MIAFAHLGHWYVQLAFAAPALLIIAFMTRDSLRRGGGRRKRRRASDAEQERRRKPQ